MLPVLLLLSQSVLAGGGEPMPIPGTAPVSTEYDYCTSAVLMDWDKNEALGFQVDWNGNVDETTAVPLQMRRFRFGDKSVDWAVLPFYTQIPWLMFIDQLEMTVTVSFDRERGKFLLVPPQETRPYVQTIQGLTGHIEIIAYEDCVQ